MTHRETVRLVGHKLQEITATVAADICRRKVEESFKAKIEKRTGNFDNLPKKITKIN